MQKYKLNDSLKFNFFGRKYPPPFTFYKRKKRGQGKNSKMPVSSYFHIYGIGLGILGYVRVNECTDRAPRRGKK